MALDMFSEAAMHAVIRINEHDVGGCQTSRHKK
jgi:hypothetical protein